MSAHGKRLYRTFTHREAVLRVCCDRFDVVTTEIIRQRQILEGYIRRDREFLRTLTPIELCSDAPEVARRMARAAQRVGVGPMAAVAGTMAQMAAEAAIASGASEAIVDNGGDLYIQAIDPLTVGLGAGAGTLADRLAFLLTGDETPIAICSSSGRMGHSMSLGRCDLATVVAKDAALADAAATLAANLVHEVEDVDTALERVVAIQGVKGVLIVQDDHVGLAGRLPQLTRKR